jgi:hypothetical protein
MVSHHTIHGLYIKFPWFCILCMWSPMRIQYQRILKKQQFQLQNLRGDYIYIYTYIPTFLFNNVTTYLNMIHLWKCVQYTTVTTSQLPRLATSFSIQYYTKRVSEASARRDEWSVTSTASRPKLSNSLTTHFRAGRHVVILDCRKLVLDCDGLQWCNIHTKFRQN